eukprot:4333078-Alexandrium_andersonii.AAC.1
MSRDALGIRAQLRRTDAQVQLDRTAPFGGPSGREARVRVPLPWGSLGTEYNCTDLEVDGESDYEIDESPDEAARWLAAVYGSPPSLRATAHTRLLAALH